MAKKRGTLSEELFVDMTAPFQLWENGVLYTERCTGVLDIGDGYLRFRMGKRPCTVWGNGLEIVSYEGRRLLARGEVTRIEFD